MTHIDGLFRDHKPQKRGPKPKPAAQLRSARAKPILCHCGCGETIQSHDHLGRPRRYVNGHQTRVLRQASDGWSEQQRIEFRDLWLAGETCAAIAEVVGMPRNTVPGRAKRMGLPGRPSPLKLTTEQRRARAITQRKREAERAGVKANKPKRTLRIVADNSASNPGKPIKVRRVPRLMVDLEQTRNLLVGELNQHVCGFPTSTEAAPTHSGVLHKFCGCATEAGKMFCPGHMAIAFPKSTVLEEEIAA